MRYLKYLPLCLFLGHYSASTTAAAPVKPGFDVHSFMPILIIFAVFYFLLIRPQNKREQERRELLKSITKGEEVITSGGMFAKVNRIISETEVEAEVAPGVLIKILRNNIIDLPNRRPKEEAKPEKTIAEIKKEVKNKNKNDLKIGKEFSEKASKNKDELKIDKEPEDKPVNKKATANKKN